MTRWPALAHKYHKMQGPDAVSLSAELGVGAPCATNRGCGILLPGGSSVDQDKTVELVTNLDRAAIEEKLGQIVAAAKSQNLEDIVTLLGAYAGMGQDELRKRVGLCLHALSGSPEHKALFTQLELVELNLHNLG